MGLRDVEEGLDNGSRASECTLSHQIDNDSSVFIPTVGALIRDLEQHHKKLRMHAMVSSCLSS